MTTTNTITDLKQLFAGHTFECDVCGNTFRSTENGAAIHVFTNSLEAKCVACAERNFEHNAREFVMLELAKQTESECVDQGHYLNGYGNGASVHLPTHEAALRTLQELGTLGVSGLLMSDEPRVTVRLEHGRVLEAVAQRVAPSKKQAV
jgi:hypothetical protein